MINKILITLIVSFLFSCRVSQLDPDVQVCPVHNQKLKTILVKTHYGRFCPEWSGIEAPYGKRIAYMGCVVRFPKKYFARIKYCSECGKISKKINIERLGNE